MVESSQKQLLLTATEAARLLGISRSHFFELRRRGEIRIPAIRVGRRDRFPRKEIEEWVRRAAEEAA